MSRRHQRQLKFNNTISDLENKLTAFTHMLKSPRDNFLEKQQQIDELFSGLNYNMRHALELAAQRSSALIQRLEALSPLAILSRGYSLSVLMPGGAILKDVRTIKPGDKLKTVLHKGAFTSAVLEVFNDERNAKRFV